MDTLINPPLFPKRWDWLRDFQLKPDDPNPLPPLLVSVKLSTNSYSIFIYYLGIS